MKNIFIKLVLIILLISSLSCCKSFQVKRNSEKNQNEIINEFENKYARFYDKLSLLQDTLNNQSNDYLIYLVRANEYRKYEGNISAFIFVKELDMTYINKIDLYNVYPYTMKESNEHFFNKMVKLIQCSKKDTLIEEPLSTAFISYNVVLRVNGKFFNFYTTNQSKENVCLDNIMEKFRNYLFEYEMIGIWNFNR